jgi:proton glutamate symport protein
VEATRKLADRCGITDAERDDIIRTNLSVAYPMGQLGNFFVYLFLLFAAYYYKVPLDSRDQALSRS